MLAISRLTLMMALLGTTPAAAVGLGPLAKEGITDSDRKGFYLTVINPYPFVLAAVERERAGERYQ